MNLKEFKKQSKESEINGKHPKASEKNMKKKIVKNLKESEGIGRNLREFQEI